MKKIHKFNKSPKNSSYFSTLWDSVTEQTGHFDVLIIHIMQRYELVLLAFIAPACLHPVGNDEAPPLLDLTDIKRQRSNALV